MKLLATLVTLLLTMSAQAGVEITNAEFVLKLEGDWVRVPSSDTNQFSFESKSNMTSIVVSVMSINVAQEKLVEVAKEFAELRQKAEQDSRKGQKIQFGDKWVKLRPSKDVAEVAYAGYDDKTIFRFMGFVTQQKVLSFWVATESHDNALSKQVYDKAYKGLKFYVP